MQNRTIHWTSPTAIDTQQLLGSESGVFLRAFSRRGRNAVGLPQNPLPNWSGVTRGEAQVNSSPFPNTHMETEHFHKDKGVVEVFATSPPWLLAILLQKCLCECQELWAMVNVCQPVLREGQSALNTRAEEGLLSARLRAGTGWWWALSTAVMAQRAGGTHRITGLP